MKKTKLIYERCIIIMLNKWR